jgi:hypothetical protein
MPALTRRRYPERHDCWHVYCGDVHVGTIALRTGVPHDADPWGWSCGFYPGSHPGECTNGSAATFDDARAGFEAAWRVFLAKRTEADFHARIGFVTYIPGRGPRFFFGTAWNKGFD